MSGDTEPEAQATAIFCQMCHDLDRLDRYELVGLRNLIDQRLGTDQPTEWHCNVRFSNSTGEELR